jgi:hypothetical protein
MTENYDPEKTDEPPTSSLFMREMRKSYCQSPGNWDKEVLQVRRK